MAMQLFRKSVPLFSALAFLGLSGCGAETAPTQAATEDPKTDTNTDTPALAATKQKLAANLQTLVSKTRDPKLKAALEQASAVLALAPTEEAAQTFYAAYSLPSITAKEVEAVNKTGMYFSLPRDPDAPRLDIDRNAFAPKTPTAQMAILLLENAAPLIALNQKDYDLLVNDIVRVVANTTSRRSKDAGFSIFNMPESLAPLITIGCVVNAAGCRNRKGAPLKIDPPNYFLASFFTQYYKFLVTDMVDNKKVNDKGIARFTKLSDNEAVVWINDVADKKSFNAFTSLEELTKRIHDHQPIGGTVVLPAGQVVLQLNGANDLTVTAAGKFTFTAKQIRHTPYKVTVKTPPAGTTCTLANGEGYADEAVADIEVTCQAPTRTVGGEVSGLPSGKSVVLTLGNDIDLTAGNGSFTFSSGIAAGSAYTVTVKTNPEGYLCQVTSGGTGTATNNVTNVAVSCQAQAFTVGGTVEIVGGTQVSVPLTLTTTNPTSSQSLSATGSGPFTFPTPLPTGTQFDVNFASQPEGYQCVFQQNQNGQSGQTGTIGTANISNLAVVCSSTQQAPTYTVGGVVTGLENAEQVILSLTIPMGPSQQVEVGTQNNGAFTFPTGLNNGAVFEIEVTAQPNGKTCEVTNPTPEQPGTIVGANYSTVAVTCAPTAPFR